MITLIVIRLSRIRVKNPPIMDLWGQDDGIPVGHKFPIAGFQTFDGAVEPLLNSKKTGTLFIIASTACPSCLDLYPLLEPFHSSHGELMLMLAVNDQANVMGQVIREHGLTFPVVRVDQQGLEIMRNTIVPFAYFIDSSGKILGKGVINNRADLEALLKASRGL